MAGLLDKTTHYYWARTLTSLGFVAAGWVAFVLIGDSWWQLITAAYLGFWTVQVALIAHDLGHLQVARSPRVNELLGYLLQNVVFGISAGWWVGFHNKHHSHPNHCSKDPQLLARAKGLNLGNRYRSVRHLRAVTRFFPLFILLSPIARILSTHAVARRAVRRVLAEALLLGLHYSVYVFAVVTVLSAERIVYFVLLQHVFLGMYFGLVFAPNHHGLPIRDGEEIDWVQRQLLTSRNIRSNRLIHFIYGGLDYHIEHHLFPTMPRPNLRNARSIVFEYCREMDLPYCEVGLGRAYLDVARALVSKPAPTIN